MTVVHSALHSGLVHIYFNLSWFIESPAVILEIVLIAVVEAGDKNDIHILKSCCFLSLSTIQRWDVKYVGTCSH